MTVLDRTVPMLLVRLQDSNQEYRVVTDQVLSFKYTDAERKTDTCEITVDNSDLLQFDDPVWRKGGKIQVSWGYPGAMAPERTCVITSVKGFKELKIEANAESVLMNQIAKQRVFEGKTLSQIAEIIAEEYGYGSDVRFIDDTGEVIEIVTQANLTDAQFLRERASEAGFEFYIDFDGFHFHERRLGEPPARTLHYFTDPNIGDFVGDPTIENDLTARPGRVVVRGRNPRTREDIEATADNTTDSNRTTLTHIVDVPDPETGAITEVERRVAQEQTVTTADETSTRATRRARGRYRRTQQVAVKMKAKIVGDPVLLAKTIVQIVGMGQRLSVKYYLEEVVHNLEPGGYTCDLKLVSDGHGGHSTTSTQAQGLSLLNVQQTRSTRGTSQDVQEGLSEAIERARTAGDTDTVERLQRAQSAYSRGGNANREQVQRELTAISNDPGVAATVRQSVNETRGTLSQRGNETPSGGHVNDREVNQNSQSELEPQDVPDPETGELQTVYRQTPSRGTGSRNSSGGSST